MHKVLRILLILTIVVALGWITAACQAPSQTPQIGKTAPDFELLSLDGQSVSLCGFRGQPVLLNFWTTWCPPCRYEMPILQSASEEFAGEGLVILAIDIGESLSGVESFMESNGFTFTALLDTDQQVSLKYNVRSMPTSFFIDEDGIIKAIKIGAYLSRIDIKRDLRTIIP